jgi:hypothetical protein
VPRAASTVTHDISRVFGVGVDQMPCDGATIPSDLIGKLDAVRVTCDRCGRKGRHRLQNLIAERGGDASVVDWLAPQTVR